MLYLLLKSVHILAVVTWVAGMVAAALVLLRPAESTLATLNGWDKRVTAPAMGLAWVLGLVLAYWGGWFGSPWLWVKLVAVFVLSGLHGMLSGQLRRASDSADPAGHTSPAKPALVLTFVLVAVVILLVETKLF